MIGNIRFYQVDAFTAQPFKGNQAGVCILHEPLTNVMMQKIAAEMNLPETAFLVMEKGVYILKWFTPTVEIPLCGHGTLATAHILWEQNLIGDAKAIEFNTLSGLLTVTKSDDGWITLKFPAYDSKPMDMPPILNEQFPRFSAVMGSNNRILIELPSEDDIRSFQPDFTLLKKFRVIITSRAHDKSYDFISRYFAAPHGVAEDPVTGSAHCSLAPFWYQRLNKTKMVAYQASARGGFLRVEYIDPYVYLSGQAVTVLSGSIFI